MTVFKNPAPDCPRCPRLAAFRGENKAKFPEKFNAPVPSFGGLDAQLLVLGLAPGLKGANFTGRPFTGDYAGDLLYKTLLEQGFATGDYGAHANDGLALVNCRISNAVRCVPPQNKPTTEETKTCLSFLKEERAAMPDLKVIVSLGKIAHDAVVRDYGLKLSAFKFAHNVRHKLPDGVTLVNSYHCSRYNTQTGRLTDAMFTDVFLSVKDVLGAA